VSRACTWRVKTDVSMMIIYHQTQESFSADYTPLAYLCQVNEKCRIQPKRVFLYALIIDSMLEAHAESDNHKPVCRTRCYVPKRKTILISRSSCAR
jgi:hypothetical protein